MTEQKHTPGPWKIAKTSWPMTITGNVHQVTNCERFPAAFIPAWDAPEAGEVDGTDEALANALLIAASPELLESLRKLAAEVGGLRAFESELRAEISATNWNVLMLRLSEAAAAIAKATGQ